MAVRTVGDSVKSCDDPGECWLEMKLFLCSKFDGMCFVRNLEAVMSVYICDGETGENPWKSMRCSLYSFIITHWYFRLDFVFLINKSFSSAA